MVRCNWAPEHTGGIVGGRDVRPITAHIDIMPTLLELCGIDPPEGVQIDGKSLVPLLTRNEEGWPERTIFVHNQRVLDPIKCRNTSVMTDRSICPSTCALESASMLWLPSAW